MGTNWFWWGTLSFGKWNNLCSRLMHCIWRNYIYKRVNSWGACKIYSWKRKNYIQKLLRWNFTCCWWRKYGKTLIISSVYFALVNICQCNCKRFRIKFEKCTELCTECRRPSRKLANFSNSFLSLCKAPLVCILHRCY